MANVQITSLPNAGPLTGLEQVPVVQNGVTVRTTTGDIASTPFATQTFLTVNLETSLANSRYFSTDANLTITDNGAQSSYVIGLTGAIADLNALGNGFVVKTDALTFTPREITTIGAGIAISNGNGISGNPQIGLSGLPLILAQASGSGLLALDSGSSLSPVTITGTTSQIGVSNGTGVGGNPTIYIADNPIMPGTGSMRIPTGTTAQRPIVGADGEIRFNTDSAEFEFFDTGVWTTFGTGSGSVTSVTGTVNQIIVSNPTTTPIVAIADNPVLPGNSGTTIPVGTTSQRSGDDGTLRYNTDTRTFEGKANGAWGAIVSGSGVTSVDVSGGATGLTFSGGPITSAGVITMAGTLDVANGGTGATTLTGYVKGNGTSPFTASSTIPTTDLSGTITNAQLQYSSITINGNSVSLGGSTTVTASTTAALTMNNSGTGAASGTTFNGGTAVTLSYNTIGASPLAGSTSLVTLGTITTGVWHGSTIDNSYLTNSAITINGSSVSLGGSITVTASTTAALTVGTGLQLNSGTTFDGSTAKTITIDSTVATLTGIQTLTNKSMSGSSNTFTNIPNSALTNSSLTIGTTSISLGGTSLTLGGLTSVTVTQDPVSDLQLATKQYVDSVAQGLNAKAACVYGTTGDITLLGLATQAGGDWASSLTAGDRILVKNQLLSQFNGIYVAASGAWTRSTDMDTWTEVPSSFVFIEDGTTLSDTGWVTTANVGGTINVTPMPWVQFSGAGTYTAGTGLTLTGTQFSITNTAVTAASYGSASQVATFTVNSQGQLTLAANTSIAINGNQITSGTVGSAYISGSYTGITGVGTLTAGTWNASTIDVGYGGTNLTSYTTGDMIYASSSSVLSKLGIGTNGYIMTSSGTAPQWTNPTSISINTATNLAGGTTGAVPYQSGVGATTFLSLGTTNYVMTAGASAPQYVAQSTLSVGSATNATNTAITSSTTNADFYLTFVSATSGNLGQTVNSSIKCNPSTGVLTGGISGGTF